MSTTTRLLGRFGELDLQEQLLTLGSWIVAAGIFSMIAVDGYFWPTSVGIVIGVIVGTAVAWSVASLLGE